MSWNEAKDMEGWVKNVTVLFAFWREEMTTTTTTTMMMMKYIL